VHELGGGAPEAGQWTLGSYERLIQEGQRGWVAEFGGSLSGFLVVRIIPPEMEIMNLVVAGELRRKGVAAALLAAAEKAAREKKVSRAFLEVRESNGAAIAFYEGNGFAKMGRRANYYANPAEAAILMEKGIDL
jgi:ribosomal-protein-alanine acetyltransferase